MNMQEKVNLLILTPDKVFFQGEVEQIIVATPEGEMGIMPEHMTTIAVVPESDIRIKTEKGADWHTAAVGQGFLDVTQTDIEIFVDSAEWSEEIDVSRSEAALHRAEERLHAKLSHEEYLRTHAAVARAHARLKAAKST
jgi:F-type H+-transporting ATPase subunit epsilon